ncbi:MAG: sigma-70 family RNA polymerase sigma factor [Fluviicoccus sp.]|uniref:sigma-70 family RNA polymerase sigma factor n=1 Tax=Fluviicoccus sp. TaxID=2003552 RepID=UPI0027187C16|nr:sigma-70 family RNA polymerase sigma factor [Fluviicoccus sp.]MDO8330497.1 sigma-70 family RNA polymerase sigma factor [Fluviicoccus sp.]
MSNYSQVESDAAAEGELWQYWKTSQNPAGRATLFYYYSDWCRMLAGQIQGLYPHRLADWGDYVHFASQGLLIALDRFDPDRGVRFQTFAEHYVKGAVLKGLSCYVQDLPAVHQTKNIPLAIDTAEVSFELLVDTAIDLAFGYFLESGLVDRQLESGPMDAYAREQQHNLLGGFVAVLPENEKQVIVGHYYQYLSFVEISELLGVSKARVSQLHKQALKKIRLGFEQTDDLDICW